MIKRLSLAAIVIALAACSSNPNEHKPSPLPVLPAKTQQIKAQKIYTVQIGKGLNVTEVAPHLAMQNDKLYAASHNGVIAAIDVQGKTVWQQQTQQTVTGGVSAAYGRVVVATATADVWLLDANTGAVQWRKTLLSPILAAAAQSAERVIVQSSDGKVYGLDAKTGNTIWVFDTPVAALSLRGYASPVVMNENVIVTTELGKVMALDANTGIAQWESRVATPDGRSELERMVDIDGAMLVNDDTLYVGSYQGQLTALNVRTKPQLKWQQALSSYRALAQSDTQLFAVDASSHVIAFDKITGQVLWKQQALAWRNLSKPVSFNNYLLVGDNDGYVHIMAQDSGKLLGRFSVKGTVVDLTVFNQQLWVHTQKGQLSAWSFAGAVAQ